MSKIFDWFKKVFLGIKFIYFRFGMDKFLSQYIEVAIEILVDLAKVNSNAAFHEWEQQAFQKLKDRIGKPVADTWIAILINLAWEVLKARQTQNPIKLG